jgi:hypothetical protein
MFEISMKNLKIMAKSLNDAKKTNLVLFLIEIDKFSPYQMMAREKRFHFVTVYRLHIVITY